MLLGPSSSSTIQQGHSPPTNPPLSSISSFLHTLIKLKHLSFIMSFLILDFITLSKFITFVLAISPILKSVDRQLPSICFVVDQIKAIKTRSVNYMHRLCMTVACNPRFDMVIVFQWIRKDLFETLSVKKQMDLQYPMTTKSFVAIMLGPIIYEKTFTVCQKFHTTYIHVRNR